MQSRIWRFTIVGAVAILAPSLAHAYTITVNYQGAVLGSVSEGQTLTVPDFDSLPLSVRTFIQDAGLLDEYLRLEGTKLVIPVGSLTEDIVVAVEPVEIPGAVVAFSFAVDGSTEDYFFALPLQITLPYGTAIDLVNDEDSLILAFYSDGAFSTDGITDLVVDVLNDLVTANIAHLSTVAVKDSSKALPTLTLLGLAGAVAAVGAAGALAIKRLRS
ncbi:MAG: hypothetical protein JXR94_20045 [Candidatus Hydrogenedentes bacterium]|nr:hypothetical protein [Candidatus Hydrogenedentota bacterium]